MENNLWKLLANGGERTDEYLFDQYYLKLCHIAFMYVKDTFVAENLVGDLFFYLWKNRTTIQVNESISSYLFSAIRNRAINYQNQASVNREIHFSQYEELEDFSMFESKDSLPLEQIIEKELADRIRKSVNSLPMQTRKVFELKREQNFSYDEIALQLHISINTVRFHIKTAMKKLRVELGDYLTVLLLFLYKIL